MYGKITHARFGQNNVRTFRWRNVANSTKCDCIFTIYTRTLFFPWRT